MKVIENKEKFNIKWCPFCGGKGVLKSCSSPYRQEVSRKNMYIREFRVECENNNCGISTDIFISQVFLDEDGNIQIIHNGAEEAIATWNRRYEA